MLPGDVKSSLIQSTGGNILLPAIAYKSELKVIPQGFLDKYNFQFSSIKNFNFFIQNAANANDLVYKRSVTGRPICGLNLWNLNINCSVYPSRAIDSKPKMYMETLRAWDAMTDTNGGDIISTYNYAPPAGTGSAAGDFVDDRNRFLAAVDLDRFNHSTDALLSGTDTIGQSVNLNMEFTVAAPAALNVYAFVMYDVMYNLNRSLFTAIV
jgi:hypothetical protein